MNTTEKIKQLEKQLAELKREVEKEKEKEVDYKMKQPDDLIYYIDDMGNVGDYTTTYKGEELLPNESKHRSILEWALLAIDMHNWAAHYNEEFGDEIWTFESKRDIVLINCTKSTIINALQFSSYQIAIEFRKYFGEEKIRQYLTRPY